MKKVIFFICAAFMCLNVFAQQSSAYLPLSIIIQDLPQPFPENAKTQLHGKVSQMLTANGLGSYNSYSGFFITAVANPINKEVAPGAPAQIFQTLEITFYIADYERQLVYSTYSVTTKGVGTTEAKSYLDAFKRIRVNTPEAAAFIAKGRDKIVSYFDAEAENIFAKARQLAQQHNYEAALYELSNFPSVCSSYAKSLEVGNEIYQHYIDYQAQQYLQKAKAAWMSQQNSAGADAAGEWLSQILPEATCYPEAVELYNEIKKKVLDDWKWEMKKYEDSLDLEKRKLATEDKRVSAWKEVGVAYGQNQQPVTTHVNWLR
jgi:hypothetical protein